MQQASKWWCRCWCIAGGLLVATALAVVPLGARPASTPQARAEGAGQLNRRAMPAGSPDQAARAAAGQVEALGSALFRALGAQLLRGAQQEGIRAGSLAALAMPGRPVQWVALLQLNATAGSESPLRRGVPGPGSASVEEAIPLGLLVQGDSAGSRALRVLRASVRNSGGNLLLQLKGDRDAVIWEGPSAQPLPPGTSGPQLRPIVISKVICIEKLDMFGEWPGFVPASEEGDLPVTVECVDLGWLIATGNLRTVGQWGVPRSVWSRPGVIAVAPDPSYHRQVSGAVEALQAALDQAGQALGEGPVEMASFAFTYVPERATHRLSGTAAGIGGMRSGPQPAFSLLTVSTASSTLAATQFQANPQGSWSQTSRVVGPDGRVVAEPTAGAEVLPGQAGQGRRGLPYLVVDQEAVRIGTALGNRIVIKCCSTWRPGCRCSMWLTE